MFEIKENLKKLLVAFSLSNLCFLQGWSLLLSSSSHSHYYYWANFPGWSELIALIINVFIFTLIFFAAYKIVKRQNNPTLNKITQILFLLLLLFILNTTRNQMRITFQDFVMHVSLAGVIAILLLCLTGIFFLFKFVEISRLIHFLLNVVLIFSLFGLIAFSQAVFANFKYGNAMSNAKKFKPQRQNSLKTKQRIVWFIFDEFDENVAFISRPNSIALPEFDRLRNESFVAKNATSPSNETLLSLPSLFTGKKVVSAKPVSPNELSITQENSQTELKWSEQQTIFSDVYDMGLKSALVGWYHPYCRLFGSKINSCHWTQQGAKTETIGITQHIFSQQRNLITNIPFGFRLIGLPIEQIKKDHIREYQEIYERALEVSANPDYDFVFVHWSIPHFPSIYDRKTNSLTSTHSGSYLDNLKLADETLGRVREAMEQNSVWDNTVLLISSDHWWRKEQQKKNVNLTEEDKALKPDIKDYRVPFILKLAGENKGASYEKSFNTVLTKELLLSILRGEIVSGEQITLWLNARL